MCGRYTFFAEPEELTDLFDLLDAPRYPPRYNIAPTQPVPAVRPDDQGRRFMVEMRWGLIPSWSKDPRIGARLINARIESVAEKPAYRAAFRRRRCLLPARGFYEWQRRGSRKQPYYVHLRGGELFAFAGLFEHWRSPEGDSIDTCTILTTEACEPIRDIHPRMPVVLSPEVYALWLDPTLQAPDRLRGLLELLPPEVWEVYPVSTHVNSPAHDDPTCIQRVSSL